VPFWSNSESDESPSRCAPNRESLCTRNLQNNLLFRKRSSVHDADYSNSNRPSLAKSKQISIAAISPNPDSSVSYIAAYVEVRAAARRERAAS
jgi:hypothetical protein